MHPSDVMIVSAARTPIGRYGGSFRNVHPAELGAVAARGALERAGIAPDTIGEVVMGHGRQAGSGPNPARQVGRRAGLPDEVPAQTINKACASGMQAVTVMRSKRLLHGATHDRGRVSSRFYVHCGQWMAEGSTEFATSPSRALPTTPAPSPRPRRRPG